MHTPLKGYDLWYDGSVVISSTEIEQFVARVPGNKLFVDKITDEIAQFNKLVSKSERISTNKESVEFNFDWDIPEPFKSLDVMAHVMEKWEQMSDQFSDAEEELRILRIAHEMRTYKSHDLQNMLRCLIYIVHILTENNIVWGVGRGSCVSSYVLYLIGVHDIDCVLYDLPFTDFIKG